MGIITDDDIKLFMSNEEDAAFIKNLSGKYALKDFAKVDLDVKEKHCCLTPLRDIITIQLGENVSDTATYEKDFISLVKYVKTKAPNARILVIDDFWNNGDRNQIKINAIESTGIEHVSLEGITENSEYYCGVGVTVYDDDGNAHVEHLGDPITKMLQMDGNEKLLINEKGN